MVTFSGLAGYSSFFLSMTLINVIAVLGLNLQWGQTGLFNVGVSAFIAIGAYACALLTTTDPALGACHLPMAWGWIAAMLLSGIACLVLGAMTLRLRTDYLAITTFGFAVVVMLALQNLQSVTGGPLGVSLIPRPWETLASNPLSFGLANLLLLSFIVLVLYVGLERLAHSPWGRVLKAIREDEDAAASLGKNPTVYRLQAFALGGALMGLAGATQASFIGFIAPENFQASLTFQIWTMLIIGGAGSNAGAIFGTALVWALWSSTGLLTSSVFPAEDQARAAALRIVAIGILLAVTLIWRPHGLLTRSKTVTTSDKA